jgi:hypothetical protein
MSFTAEIQKISSEISNLQYNLKATEAAADAEKKSITRNNYITKLTDYLNNFTENFINKQLDKKRAELMVKVEVELDIYKKRLI